MDGTAIDSCIYLGVWAQGKSILTVEGLQEPDGGLSPIQRAFVEEAAVQCGFCTPGIIMSAVEIVGSGKQYTREELRKLISGHLCRCTGYQNILNAVERAVDEAHRFVGIGEKRHTGDACRASPVLLADEGIGPYGPCGIGSQYVHTWSGVRFLRRGQ